jgi:hypothetical protein
MGQENRRFRRGSEAVWQRLSLSVLLVVALPLLAQQPQGEVAERFLLDEAARAAAAAASLVGMGDVPGAVGLLYAGRGTSIWEGATPQSVVVRSPNLSAPRVDPDLLAGVEDQAPVRSADQNPDEVRAYIYLLVQAHATSAEAFARSARRDVTYAHLFEEPGKYRGQVVHVQGRLKRLRRFDAPAFAAHQGVPVIYEGWIFDDLYHRHPFCVVVTDLPPGISVGERTDYPVSVDGYFFKRYRYKAGEGWRDAPLLIGRTFLTQPASVAGGNEWSATNDLAPAILGLLAASVLLVLGLGWWYRRSDRRLRSRLAVARGVSFQGFGPEEDPPSVPNGPVDHR